MAGECVVCLSMILVTDEMQKNFEELEKIREKKCTVILSMAMGIKILT